ncbi:MAG: hypothetical protein AAF708_16840 [Deinococcota bacterium]
MSVSQGIKTFTGTSAVGQAEAAEDAEQRTNEWLESNKLRPEIIIMSSSSTAAMRTPEDSTSYLEFAHTITIVYKLTVDSGRRAPELAQDTGRQASKSISVKSPKR